MRVERFARYGVNPQEFSQEGVARLEEERRRSFCPQRPPCALLPADVAIDLDANKLGLFCFLKQRTHPARYDAIREEAFDCPTGESLNRHDLLAVYLAQV